jgi:hypothetical protein
MGLENRYSNLGGKPYNVTNNPVTIDSVLANRPQNTTSQPTSTVNINSVLANKSQVISNTPAVNSSTLAFRPINVQNQPGGASSLEARPQNPKDKLGRRSLPQRSLFSATTPTANNFFIPVISNPPSSPSPSPIPEPEPPTPPTPTPGIGAFSTAFSNAYDGTGIGSFSFAFSNAF